jgi:hypothetical protein
MVTLNRLMWQLQNLIKKNIKKVKKVLDKVLIYIIIEGIGCNNQ